jgi:guanine nucleotide-binding protein subunit alpha
MHEALMMVNVANSIGFRHSAVVLLFHDQDEMERKLSTGNSSVSRWFPDYHGGATDAVAASYFFNKKFRGLI